MEILNWKTNNLGHQERRKRNRVSKYSRKSLELKKICLSAESTWITLSDGIFNVYVCNI